jgi:hypothetical protein
VTSGYSGTPLAKKLGIKAAARVFVHAAPANYPDLLAPLPPGVQFVRRVAQDTDLMHLFGARREPLRKALQAARQAMRDDAVIWVSWPKKASQVPTDMSEDVVRELAFPLGLVDVKVCAVDEIWSGLKLVVRLSERAKPAPRARRAARPRRA